MHKALLALEALPVDHIPAGAAVRLLDVGARLEQRHAHGLSRRAPGPDLAGAVPAEDPWDKLARELTGS